MSEGLPWQDGARTRVFRARNKHKATTAGVGWTCSHQTHSNSKQWTTEQSIQQKDNFIRSYLLWMLGCAHIASARVFSDSKNGNINEILRCCLHISSMFWVIGTEQSLTFERFDLCVSVRRWREVPAQNETGGRHGSVTCGKQQSKVKIY